MNILKNLNQEGRTVIVVTHDPFVSGMCNRIIEIADGGIVA